MQYINNIGLPWCIVTRITDTAEDRNKKPITLQVLWNCNFHHPYYKLFWGTVEQQNTEGHKLSTDLSEQLRLSEESSFNFQKGVKGWA